MASSETKKKCWHYLIYLVGMEIKFGYKWYIK